MNSSECCGRGSHVGLQKGNCYFNKYFRPDRCGASALRFSNRNSLHVSLINQICNSNNVAILSAQAIDSNINLNHATAAITSIPSIQHYWYPARPWCYEYSFSALVEISTIYFPHRFTPSIKWIYAWTWDRQRGIPLSNLFYWGSTQSRPTNLCEKRTYEAAFCKTSNLLGKCSLRIHLFRIG